MAASFRRVAILGTGLIGGSFALALRKHAPETAVVGWDREDVLREALQRGAIGESTRDISRAMSGADLIYLALPVGHTIELLPEVARLASPQALVTDTSSTKRWVCAVAAECFAGEGARFLGGHPMAGKEISGIASAEADLFRGAKYALIGNPGAESELARDGRVTEFAALVARLGAEAIWLDAEAHDRAVAIISHLPQLLAVALADVVRNETDETGFPMALAGRGLRDALRLAGSPYSVWRDIILTNSDNLDRALDLLIQSLDQIREELRTRARGKICRRRRTV